jgi:hypothetical protein
MFEGEKTCMCLFCMDSIVVSCAEQIFSQSHHSVTKINHSTRTRTRRASKPSSSSSSSSS